MVSLEQSGKRFFPVSCHAAPAHDPLIVLHRFEVLTVVLERIPSLRKDFSGYVDALQARMEHGIHLIVRIIFSVDAQLSCKDSHDSIPGHQKHFILRTEACLKRKRGGNDLMIGLIFLEIVLEILAAWLGLDPEPICAVLGHFFDSLNDLPCIPANIRLILQLIQFFQNDPRNCENGVVASKDFEGLRIVYEHARV